MEMKLSAAVRAGDLGRARPTKRTLATPVVCPASGKAYSLGAIILDLRDLFRWKAARIAQWLEDIGL